MTRPDIDVYVDRSNAPVHVGTIRRYARHGGESISFTYAGEWSARRDAFAVDPALPLQRGVFVPAGGGSMFGAFSDVSPDSWGRRIMQRAIRRRSERSGATVQTLLESDYLLGVTDELRMGALRFCIAGEPEFQAPSKSGVPQFVALGKLQEQIIRYVRNDDVDDALLELLAPGSSLGGARPKASILDQHGVLSIAKFGKETDEYGLERWESVAFDLAKNAGITTAVQTLIEVSGSAVFLSARFDRRGAARIPYISALTMLGLQDGERASYIEIAEMLREYGSDPKADCRELFRRMIFNICISNVDDHLRNHGFLLAPEGGWKLSPAFDLNPVPADIKRRVLTTHITLDDGTCDLDAALSVASFFNVSVRDARLIAAEVATAVAEWRTIARRTGIATAEIRRMASAFEHDDLRKALAFSQAPG